MTRNPYAHPMGDEPVLDTPSRVSGLAVSSLIFSLICCIPGSGLIGTILGGAGLVAISKSEGRLSGRTLAFIGVVLGVLVTGFWLALGVGLRQGVVIAEREIFKPAVAMAQAMESQDWAAAHKLIDPKVSEDELKAFAEKIKTDFGSIVGLPQQMDFSKMFPSQGGPAVTLPSGSTVLPLPLEFKQGAATVFLVTDSPTTLGDVFLNHGTLDGKLTNIGVVGNGKEVWLVDTKKSGTKGAKGGSGGT